MGWHPTLGRDRDVGTRGDRDTATEGTQVCGEKGLSGRGMTRTR